ncbi:hypothetical protein [Borreliella kurtenbachii]|uniref:hypothetical protein n=1 Tax=Borreliella kurtenbachii TaxID=1196056 RepID=UPI0034633998
MISSCKNYSSSGDLKSKEQNLKGKAKEFLDVLDPKDKLKDKELARGFEDFSSVGLEGKGAMQHTKKINHKS